MSEPESTTYIEEDKERFVLFELGTKHIGAIPVNYIAEVFQISLVAILPVPEVPVSVLGLYNWRGEMLWWVDLEHLVGLEPITQERDSGNIHMAIVIQAREKSLGLLVRELVDIEWLFLREMKSSATGLFPGELYSFLEGYFIKDDQKTILSLDPVAILESTAWGDRALIDRRS